MIRLVALLSITTLLGGCAGAAISGSTYAIKSANRAALEDLAEAGDPQAQYELGKSWCCMGPGFDTQTATLWLCKAARNGHSDAQYELGRIYSGEVSRTPAPGQKLLRLATSKKSEADALYWFSQAARQGHDQASARIVGLDDAEIDQALDNQPAHCEYNAVFGP